MSRASGDVALHLNLQQLEDTAALGRALISGLPGAGLLILDADLRILLADGDAHQRVGADIHGRLVWDVVPADGLGASSSRATGRRSRVSCRRSTSIRRARQRHRSMPFASHRSATTRT